MKFLYPCFFLFIGFFCAQAQNEAKHNLGISARDLIKEPWPKSVVMHVSFFNHSVSLPFHKVISAPLHLGGQLGTEVRYFETKRSKLLQTLNVGLFHNTYNGTGLYMNTELGYRYKSKYGVFVESLIGAGYLRVYHPTDIYKLTLSGVYEKVKDKGFSSPLFSFAVGVGYALRSSSAFSLAPFIRYESLVQTRYNAELGVFPQSAFHLGIRVSKSKVE